MFGLLTSGIHMPFKVEINVQLTPEEVPELRAHVGWSRRDNDYPTLFERCNFWAGVKNENNKLIAFGYICGMGLEHGYMEDIIVHPDYQGSGIGLKLVNVLLEEAERFGLEIITVSFEERNVNFYEKAGFAPGAGGVWQSRNY